MSTPTPDQTRRTAAQVSRERALGETSDVLLNLDHTIARAKKARTMVAKDGHVLRGRLHAPVVTELPEANVPLHDTPPT